MFFFFQAEDGIRDLVRSRGLGDVYKRQVPVDQPDRFSVLACCCLHLNAVAQQAVHRLVVVIEAAVWVVGFGAQPVQGAADLCRAVAMIGEVGREQRLFDVAVVRAVGPVAPVSYTHLRAHETVLDLVCRLLLEKKKKKKQNTTTTPSIAPTT